MATASSTAETNRITQSTFQETPYIDASWEIVGPPPTEQVFTPMQLAVVPSNEVQVDGMFADYGGFTSVKSGKRWHLPEELAAQIAESVSQDAKLAKEAHAASLALELVEQQKREAFEAGVAQGRKEATEEMHQREQILSSSCRELVRDLQVQIEEQTVAIEQQAVGLSLAIAHKLVHKAVEINPEYILQIIKSAFKEAGGGTVKQVRISPEDYEFITVVGSGAMLEGLPEGFQFVADPSIKSGCVLDTSAGQIDMQIDSAWDRVSDAIIKAVR